MTKQLHYFDVKGLAESIRYILHYGDVKFDDIRYTAETFAKVKHTMPFGQVPVYVDGDKKLNQSLAIARHVGTELGLVAGDPWKDAQLDAIIHSVYDCHSKCAPYYYLQKEGNIEAQNKLLDEITNSIIPRYMTEFDKELRANGGYFTGKLTWAEFVFCGIVECLEDYLPIKFVDNYPAIKTLQHTISTLPRVKEYINKRDNK